MRTCEYGLQNESKRVYLAEFGIKRVSKSIHGNALLIQMRRKHAMFLTKGGKKSGLAVVIVKARINVVAGQIGIPGDHCGNVTTAYA